MANLLGPGCQENSGERRLDPGAVALSRPALLDDEHPVCLGMADRPDRGSKLVGCLAGRDPATLHAGHPLGVVAQPLRRTLPVELGGLRVDGCRFPDHAEHWRDPWRPWGWET